MMKINKNITDTIGNLAFCLSQIKTLKENIGNPEKINPKTHQNNIETIKKSVSLLFQQYMGTRKTYNHDIIEIENTVAGLEKDFMDIFSLFGEPTSEQVTQLEGVIFKIQKLIIKEIQGNPSYFQQLKENFPNFFK